MIADTLNFLRRHLDERLRVELGGSQDDATGDRVVFIDGDKLEPISFQLNAVTVLLINVEEERLLRGPDLYVRANEDGTRQRVQPDIRLILYVLFVARFKKYDAGWQHLSKILEHLQTNRVFDGASAPDLPPGVDRLILELVTLDFAAQNEVWNALRTTHHPSLLYRVKLLAYRDRRPAESQEVGEQSREIGQMA
jgi:hypothetical protein